MKKDESKYLKDCFNIVQNYINDIKLLIKDQDYFYLPLIGLNKSDKTTILKNLIGYKLFPTDNDETTKREILIKYWDKDEPKIYKLKFQKNEKEKIFEFKYENILGRGFQEVFNILEDIRRN